jgi:hypothetical protein
VRNLDEEDGPRSAMHSHRASPKSLGAAANGGVESSNGIGRREVDGRRSGSVRATGNRRALIWGRGSWAEKGQARTASLRGPPRGDGVYARQELATQKATRIQCGTLTARRSRRI